MRKLEGWEAIHSYSDYAEYASAHPLYSFASEELPMWSPYDSKRGPARLRTKRPDLDEALLYEKPRVERYDKSEMIRTNLWDEHTARLHRRLGRVPTAAEYWASVQERDATTVGDLVHPRPLISLASLGVSGTGAWVLIAERDIVPALLALVLAMLMFVALRSSCRRERDRRVARIREDAPSHVGIEKERPSATEPTPSTPDPTIQRRWEHVHEVLTDLNNEWLAYTRSPQRYYLDQPLLRDQSVPEVREYRLALERLTDLSTEKTDIAKAEKAAAEAAAAWDTTQKTATRLGVETLGLTDAVTLRRCAHILAQLQDKETPPSAVAHLVEQLTKFVAKLSERVAVPSETVNATLRRIELETGRTMLALESGS